MKKLLTLCLLAVTMCVVAQDVKKVAVYIAKNDAWNQVTKNNAVVFANALQIQVNQLPQYTAVERSNKYLALLSQDHSYQRNGQVDETQVAALGKQDGVDIVLGVSILEYPDNTWYVVWKMVDVVTAELLTGNYLMKRVADILEVDGIAKELSAQIKGENHSGGSSANATTHLSQSNNTRKVGTLIYAQSKEINQYCDGKYSDKKEYFSADLDNLNREHFRIRFVFSALSYKGTLDWTSVQYPLMLSEGWRVLGVRLHEDGSIYITTNNGDYSYKTNLTYTPHEDIKMDIEYDHGKLYVNGNVYDVEMNEYNGDNTLSSINYGNGNAFRGYINSVRVYNIDD